MTETPNPFVEPKYGSFNIRVIAASIDQGIVMLFAIPISTWVTEHLYAPIDMIQLAQEPHPWAYLYENHFLGQAVTQNLIQLLFIALYTLPFWFRYSTTPGKMLFRMEIVDAGTGERMTRSQSVRRFFGYILSMLLLGTGFFYVMFNKKRRGYHDLIAGTVVVVKPKKKKVVGS